MPGVFFKLLKAVIVNIDPVFFVDLNKYFLGQHALKNIFIPVSDKSSLTFIRHYTVSSLMISIEEVGDRYEFSSGRTLKFIKTPYSHSAGSFVTYDEKSGILFTRPGPYGTRQYYSYKRLILAWQIKVRDV